MISHLGHRQLGRAPRPAPGSRGSPPREREVLALVGAGLSNADIAGRLHVVEGTVKTYVSQILARLDMKNRVQAAILAYEAGLVDGTADADEAGGSDTRANRHEERGAGQRG